MESLEHFGWNLRQHREAAALTQTDMGKVLGVGNVYLSQLEAGARLPSADLLVRVADLLKCRVSDLLTPPDVGKRGRRKRP
jgi:transcriptional regulator with XRE-family HTH domain